MVVVSHAENPFRFRLEVLFERIAKQSALIDSAVVGHVAADHHDVELLVRLRRGILVDELNHPFNAFDFRRAPVFIVDVADDSRAKNDVVRRIGEDAFGKEKQTG